MSTETAGKISTKFLLNSVVSTLGAKFMGIDIKKFCLRTTMLIYENTKIHISMILEEKILKYTLKEKVDDNSWVYI